MAKENFKSFSSDLPQDEINAFDKFIERNGYLKWRAVVAGMKALAWMPPSLRELLMSGDSEAVRSYFREADEYFSRGLGDALRRDLEDASQRQPSQKKKVAGSGK